MKHSPAHILAEYLRQGESSLGLFTDPADEGDWPLYVSSLPDGNGVPANAAAVYDTSGVKIARLNNGTNVFQYGVQVFIRSSDYIIGHGKASELESLLEGLLNEKVTIGEEVYVINTFNQTSPVLVLGQDPDTRRDAFTINGLLFLRKGE